MKNILALAAVAGLTGSAFAQLNPLPPASPLPVIEIDGQVKGVPGPAVTGDNSGITHWENPLTLGAYKFQADGDESSPDPTALGWTVNPPTSIASHLNTISLEGGTVRAIFTGESAGWLNDFGYTFSGNPAGPNSYTVFSDIQSFNATPANGTVNMAFGDYIDVVFNSSNKSSATTFDFWLNGVGAFGPDNAPGVGTNLGGVYTAFHPTNSTPYFPGQVRWAPRPLFVNTWVQALNGGLGAYADVATYLVGFEDVRPTASFYDGDTNDYMFALQFYRDDGTPFTPVPEPATYGLIGTAALVGLIVRRRFQAKKA